MAGQSTITDAIALELDKVVKIAPKFSLTAYQLSIESHTNSRGSSASKLCPIGARSKAY